MREEGIGMRRNEAVAVISNNLSCLGSFMLGVRKILKKIIWMAEHVLNRRILPSLLESILIIEVAYSEVVMLTSNT